MNSTTRERLIRLRLLLDEAQRASNDGTAIGRHLATILLDGACEYAMGLAATHLGLPVSAQAREDGFYARYKQLVGSQGDSWASGWTGVSELHSSRNSAQHRGTSVDPDDLARWSADADSFVRALCVDVFGIELRDVVLADAIRTEAVRTHFLDAEESLAANKPGEAFASAMAGLDVARLLWREQRTDAHGLTTIARGRFGFDQADQVTQAIEQIQDLVEIQPFASDLGEYVWLQARRAEADIPAASLSHEDASRALRFAFFWSLRWEAFATRYTARRWPEPTAHEAPTTEDGEGKPLLWELISVEGVRSLPDAEPIFTLSLQLANVPAAHQEEWAGFLHRALSESSPTDDLGRQTDYARIGLAGVIHFFQVPKDRDPADVVVRLGEALARAQADYEKFVAMREQWDGRYDELLEPYRHALADVGLGAEELLFGSITAWGQITDFVVGGELVDRDSWMEHDVLGAISHHIGSYDGDVQYDAGKLIFRSALTPDEAASLARLIAGDIVAARAGRAAAQQEIDVAETRLADGLRKLIAEQRQAGA